MKILFDFIKLLTEETGKLLNAILTLIKLAFSLVFASKLFEYLHGSYSLIDLTSFAEITTFFKSGLAFLVLFYFALSYAALFYIIPTIISIPFTLSADSSDEAPKLDKDQRRLFRWLLRKFKVIDIDEKGRTIKLMQNADELYEMANKVNQKEIKSGVQQLKTTVIDSIGHTYLVFTLSYFFIVSPVYKSTLLSATVISIGVILIVLYYAMLALYQIFSHAAPELVTAIDEARLKNQVVSIFEKHGISLYPPAEDSKYIDSLFRFNNQEIAIKFDFRRSDYSAYWIEHLVKKAQEENQFLMIFSSTDLASDAKALPLLHENYIQFFKIIDAETITTTLKTVLDSKFPKTS